MYKFWDPLFEVIFGKNVHDSGDKLYTDHEVKEKAIKLRDEENFLIQPLFDKATITNLVSGFGFVINNEYYLFRVLRSERLIKLGNYSANKIFEPECKITVNFKSFDAKKKMAFEKVISDWGNWCASLNMETNPNNIRYAEREAMCTALFKDGYEDAYATLVIMLNETKLKTGCVFLDL